MTSSIDFFLLLGRMVLLVTTLLSLVTMFDTVRNNSPDALELKSIEVCLKLRKFIFHVQIRVFSGLASLLYFLRLSRFNGIFHRSLRHPLRLPLATIPAGGCCSTRLRSRLPIALKTWTFESKSRCPPDFTSRGRNTRKKAQLIFLPFSSFPSIP